MNINFTLFAQAIVFAAFIWFTVKFVWPPLLRAIEARQKQIADGLAAAEQGKKSLEASSKQVKVSVANAKVKRLWDVSLGCPVPLSPSKVSVVFDTMIEPAQPQVVYVPTYNPTVVYGAWPYPAYPPYYIPPPPGYWFSRTIMTGIAWGVGIGVSNALWGGCNWGRGDVNVNVNRYNNFNRTNISNGNWNHNATHRGAVPYRDKGVAQQYGRGQAADAASRDAFRGRADAEARSPGDAEGTESPPRRQARRDADLLQDRQRRHRAEGPRRRGRRSREHCLRRAVHLDAQ